MTLSQQAAGDMRPDKPGSPGDNNMLLLHFQIHAKIFITILNYCQSAPGGWLLIGRPGEYVVSEEVATHAFS
jgi:hypothetical protein